MPPFVYKKSSTRNRSYWPYVKWVLGPLLILGPILLWLSAFTLVHKDEVSHHEWSLVLEGQGPTLYRSEGAAQLYISKKIEKIVVSGGAIVSDFFASELYIQKMIEMGVSESDLYQVQHYGQSTLEEAVQTVGFFRERKVDTVVLVTSRFHTARAKRIFNDVSQGKPYFITPNIEDPEFDPNSWMLERHARAIYLLEILKTINSWVESWTHFEPLSNVRWAHGRQFKLSFSPSRHSSRAIDVEGIESEKTESEEIDSEGVESEKVNTKIDTSLSLQAIQDSLMDELSKDSILESKKIIDSSGVKAPADTIKSDSVVSNKDSLQTSN